MRIGSSKYLTYLFSALVLTIGCSSAQTVPTESAAAGLESVCYEVFGMD